MSEEVFTNEYTPITALSEPTVPCERCKERANHELYIASNQEETIRQLEAEVDRLRWLIEQCPHCRGAGKVLTLRDGVIESFKCGPCNGAGRKSPAAPDPNRAAGDAGEGPSENI